MLSDFGKKCWRDVIQGKGLCYSLGISLGLVSLLQISFLGSHFQVCSCCYGLSYTDAWLERNDCHQQSQDQVFNSFENNLREIIRSWSKAEDSRSDWSFCAAWKITTRNLKCRSVGSQLVFFRLLSCVVWFCSLGPYICFLEAICLWLSSLWFAFEWKLNLTKN